MNKEIQKFIEFKKQIELQFFSKMNPIVAFLIKYKLMNREIIDLFQNYSYLNKDYIKNLLITPQSFPALGFKYSDFENLAINIFEIPYNTLQQATIDFLSHKAPPQLNKQKLFSFICNIFKQYNIIPYHNFTHGACVMQLFNNLLNISSNFRTLMNVDQQFLYLLICLCHDNSHPGQNNSYFVKKKSNLAYSFYNKSVLENYHIVSMFQLIEKEESNIFDYIDNEKMKQIKECVIEGILNTDMAYHFQLMKFLETYNWNLPQQKDMPKFIGSIIHAMDIGNPLLKFSNYYSQAILVSQEFHDQTIMEKLHGVEITSFFVYQNVDAFYNSQIGFINTFVLPLFRVISEKYQVDYAIKIEENLEQIKKLQEEGRSSSFMNQLNQK